MTLSKARDAERKKTQRAQVRLDKQLLSMKTSNPVQPTDSDILRAIAYLDDAPVKSTMVRPEIDADGNVIPDYD